MEGLNSSNNATEIGVISAKQDITLKFVHNSPISTANIDSFRSGNYRAYFAIRIAWQDVFGNDFRISHFRYLDELDNQPKWHHCRNGTIFS